MVDVPAEIVVACQQGDRDAQRQLFELCHRRVYRLMVRMAGTVDALDMTQQVFLRVFQTIGQFSGRSRFKTWLYRLAVNECLQFLRRRDRVNFEQLDQEPPVASSGHTSRIEQKDWLEQALNRLDPELRAIFLLREDEGLSYREIAETLQLSDGTVASQLSRARQHLKQYLVELGGED